MRMFVWAITGWLLGQALVHIAWLVIGQPKRTKAWIALDLVVVLAFFVLGVVAIVGAP